MVVMSLNIYKTLRQTALRFSPSAAGPKVGSSDSIGLLKGQSEMTLINGTLSDPNNAV